MKLVSNIRSMKKQAGMTIMEVMIVVVIIGIIAVIGIQNSGKAFTEVNVWRLSSQVSEVHSGASSWRSDGTFTGISMASLDPDFISADIGDGSGTNALGGNITIAANATDAYKLDVTLTNIPDNVAQRLAKKYGSAAAFTAGSGTIVLTLGV